MSIQEKLSNLLLSNERYQAENADGQKVLNKTLVSAYAREYNPELLTLLQSDENVKNHFFLTINGVFIFKLENFLTFINNRSFLPDSFTAFKNKIGLATDKDNYLQENRNVVLNWAYKDCVLEGGQSKDDQKRSEVFFNEVLAPDQINRLLDDKVFTNFKRYDKDGEHEVAELKKNDNLIIKGNNLVVLHSLKKRFAGKVKLIYIDPPYNTGSDSFGYNDKFNHSTWLTFMKNRLEMARELLADNGSIFIQLDWNEVHYCKILMDEVFGRANFCNEIIWCYNGPGSPHMKQFNRKHDNILWYSKSNSRLFNGNDVRIKSEVHVGGFNGEMSSDVSDEYTEKGKIPEDWWELFHTEDDLIDEFKKLYEEYKKIENKDWLKFAVASRFKVDSKNRTGYLTEKPYKLMERLIKVATNEGDLILDFFAGSGTTGYVANYLKRKFILIEQLNDTLEILTKRFENTPYVYCELANDAEEFRNQVRNANAMELPVLLEKAKQSSFLSYRVNREQFNDFENLTEDEQRTLLLQLVDANTLYVNYSDIESADYEISEVDKKLNKQFYGK